MSRVILNRPLSLEVFEKVADGAGGYGGNWSVLGTLWAQVLPAGGGASSHAGVQVRAQRLAITVRGAPVGAQSRPVVGQRFREGERVYRIETVAERDAQGKFLTCMAREETAP